MQSADFTNAQTGKLVPTIHGVAAFVPAPLPPPHLRLEPLMPVLTRSVRALGELSGIGRTLPNPYLLIQPFIRREAVASSRIEGTVTNLSELFLFELDEQTTGTPSDARKVFNYVRAIERSLQSLDHLPISNRLIREAHETLLTGVAQPRGGHIVPGEFKKDQNWIGARLIQNARFVPPPPGESYEAMGALEKYINEETDDVLPFVVKLALVHYQFETIHPFADGNGRVGRLLIPLMLCEHKQLSQPLLYLSSYFESRYESYIEKMLNVSKHGSWEDWIEFFLVGIEETCNDAIIKAQKLQDIQGRYRTAIQQARTSALLGTIVDMLFVRPAITIPDLSNRLQITYNSAKKHIARLEELQIVRPLTAGRPKIWMATEIIDIITA